MVNDNHWYNFPLLLPFSSLLYIWGFIDIWIQFDQECNCKCTINNQVPFLRGMLNKQTKQFDFAPDIFQQHLYLKNKDFQKSCSCLHPSIIEKNCIGCVQMEKIRVNPKGRLWALLATCQLRTSTLEEKLKNTSKKLVMLQILTQQYY